MRKNFILYFLLASLLFYPDETRAKGSFLDVPQTDQKVISAREAAIFYANVAARIQKEYVDEVSQEKLLEGALEGMLSSLDPHSAYLSADKLSMIKDSVRGEYGGLGVEVTLKNGLILVVSPMDDGPAHRAGLIGGDYIIMVDGKPVLNQDLGDIVKKMQGKPGTKITLTIRRGEKPPFEVTLARAIVKVKAVKWKVIHDIGYVRVISFINKNTKTEVMHAIKEIQAKLGNNLKGFVLDLRNNAGGLLEQAVDVTDVFIRAGVVVSIKGRNKEDDQVYKTSDDEDFIKGLPMVVLINGGSASASEIVAGALQDHGRAVIVGTKSFGKGSVQVIMPMTNGGAIKMTTSLYYTPLGRSIQKEGVIPDIEIEQSIGIKEIDEAKRMREADLDHAIEKGGEASAQEKKEKDDKKDKHDLKKDKRDAKKESEDNESDMEGDEALKEKLSVTDFQLKRAIDVLKGMSIYAHSIVEKRRNQTDKAKKSYN